MQLRTLQAFLDQVLEIERISDYANNGLQVEGAQEVRKAAYAVDACQATFQAALEAGADILITHHGLFWGQAVMLTGYMATRVRTLLEGGLSLYAAHLPLDLHPELGNNVALAELAGFSVSSWFAREKGVAIGCLATHSEGLTYNELLTTLNRKLGCEPLEVCPAEKLPDVIRSLGVVSGGGMKYALEAADLGADLYISGEPSHAWFHPVMERAIPTLLYGHYATETLGLQRLMAHVEQELGIPGVFVDVPTNL